MLLRFLLLFISQASTQWIDIGTQGFASMTHYGDLNSEVIGACGCVGKSAEYPTAAMSQMAYGSSQAFGPACGRCFNLTLLNAALASPVFYPPEPKSIVVKITDLCPLSKEGWCMGKQKKTNKAGHAINFDLSYPSKAIPEGWFPSNASLYGYTDFGVWNVSYAAVPCNDSWLGINDQEALGSVPDWGCCLANPDPNVVNGTCQSYSDLNGLKPDKINNAAPLMIPAAMTATIPLLYLLSVLII